MVQLKGAHQATSAFMIKVFLDLVNFQLSLLPARFFSHICSGPPLIVSFSYMLCSFVVFVFVLKCVPCVSVGAVGSQKPYWC